MKFDVETFEDSTARITVTVSPEEFEKAADSAYARNRKKFNIPGFRKGHATRALIEKMYGEGVFYEEAAERIINSTYPEAEKESGLKITSRPDIDVQKIEKGQDFRYTATVALSPPVELGPYKGIEVEKADSSVSEAEVDAELERVRKQNARLISIDDDSGTLREGDTAVIDYRGYIDGTPFEGGEGREYPLPIGSHRFVDTFEEQLIGMKPGEERKIRVTFPQDYAGETAGREAEFDVKLHKIQTEELPELDDEFASEVSEFDTLKEYRDSLMASMKAEKEKTAANENENRVVRAVVDAAHVDFPRLMIENAVDNRIDDIGRNLAQSGMKIEQFLQMTGQSAAAFRESLVPEVTDRLKVRLVFEEIARKEHIDADEETIETELRNMAGRYNMSLEKTREIMAGQMDLLREDIAVREAVDMVVAEAVLIDPKKEKTKASEAGGESSEDAHASAAKKPAKAKTAKKPAKAKSSKAKAPKEEPAAGEDTDRTDSLESGKDEVVI